MKDELSQRRASSKECSRAEEEKCEDGNKRRETCHLYIKQYKNAIEMEMRGMR